MIIRKPPSILSDMNKYPVKIFLAGSIENGKASMWQDKLIQKFKNFPDSILLLNPRRDNWDPTWSEDDENEQLQSQIDWEMIGMEHADIIVMHFEPETMSPITLLELGLHARKNKVIVHCPKGYWRRGNVLAVCRRYGITIVPSLKDLEKELRNRIAMVGLFSGIIPA